jgi:hypothetical protein
MYEADFKLEILCLSLPSAGIVPHHVQSQCKHLTSIVQLITKILVQSPFKFMICILRILKHDPHVDSALFCLEEDFFFSHRKKVRKDCLI